MARGKVIHQVPKDGAYLVTVRFVNGDVEEWKSDKEPTYYYANGQLWFKNGQVEHCIELRNVLWTAIEEIKK